MKNCLKLFEFSTYFSFLNGISKHHFDFRMKKDLLATLGRMEGIKKNKKKTKWSKLKRRKRNYPLIFNKFNNNSNNNNNNNNNNDDDDDDNNIHSPSLPPSPNYKSEHVNQVVGVTFPHSWQTMADRRGLKSTITSRVPERPSVAF